MKYFIKDMPILKNKKKYMPGDEFPFTSQDKELLPLLKIVKDKKPKKNVIKSDSSNITNTPKLESEKK